MQLSTTRRSELHGSSAIGCDVGQGGAGRRRVTIQPRVVTGVVVTTQPRAVTVWVSTRAVAAARDESGRGLATPVVLGGQASSTSVGASPTIEAYVWMVIKATVGSIYEKNSN